MFAVFIGAAIGTLLGLLAGYYEGWWDRLIMRICDVLFAFPGILLAIAVVAVLGSGIANVIIAVRHFFHPRVCPAGARQHAGVETANLYRVSTQYWCQRYDHFVASYLAWDRLFYRGVFTMRIAPRLSLPPACHFSASVRSRRHQSGEQCSMRHERIWLSRRMSLFFRPWLFF